MSPNEQLYLGMVVAAFVVFAAAIFFARLTSPFGKSDQ